MNRIDAVVASRKGEELWIAIPETHGWYEVSNLGRVRSVTRNVPAKNGSTRTHTGKIISPGTNPHSGKLQVTLRCPDNVITRKVHRLVYTSFIGPADNVLHWDDNADNNRLYNLRDGSKSDNYHDAVRNGRNMLRRPTTRVDPKIVAVIRDNRFATFPQLVRLTGVSKATVSRIRDDLGYTNKKEQ